MSQRVYGARAPATVTPPADLGEHRPHLLIDLADVVCAQVRQPLRHPARHGQHAGPYGAQNIRPLALNGLAVQQRAPAGAPIFARLALPVHGPSGRAHSSP